MSWRYEVGLNISLRAIVGFKNLAAPAAQLAQAVMTGACLQEFVDRILGVVKAMHVFAGLPSLLRSPQQGG